MFVLNLDARLVNAPSVQANTCPDGDAAP